MVLETLYDILRSEKHPLTLTIMAFIVTTVAMLLAYNSFAEATSVSTLLFITLGFMPIIHRIFISEEEKDIDEKDVPFAFIATHFDVVRAYGWIFVGMVIAFSFWAVVLPDSSEKCSGTIGCMLPTKGLVFSEQKKVHFAITGKITDGFAATGNFIGEGQCFGAGKSFERCFMLIFKNNFGVMARAIVFSFLWGAGAIELLAWNASVIGFFIGSEITEKSFSAGLSRAIGYLPHGMPEVMAYFIAAIAGGIIHAAISKKVFRHFELRTVLIDVALLCLLATITLFIAALIETAAIFNYWDISIAGVAAFFVLFFVLYIPSVRYRIDKIRESNQ